jgi:hypothetical protein
MVQGVIGEADFYPIADTAKMTNVAAIGDG